jgi:formylglycine-generating enzyme required for sulfatase activity
LTLKSLFSLRFLKSEMMERIELRMENLHKQVTEEQNKFGDYVPQECLAQSESTRTWLAKQASVGRMVLIEELKEGAESEEFIADVRAKAAVEHPLVGSIYEATLEDELYYYAHELLPGETLAARASHGQKLRPQQLVHILRRVSEANIYHESHGNATTPLTLDAIHEDNQGVVRLKNLVVAGSRLPDHSLRDVLKMGVVLEQNLDPNHPGATRCQTLLSWMRGEGISQPLEWVHIRDYCEQIEHQLTEPSHVVAPPTANMLPGNKHSVVWGLATLFVVVITGVLLSLPGEQKKVESKAPLPGWVEIKAGMHQASEGVRIQAPNFLIAACEVTIGEYAEFLETLEILSADGSQTAFDHPMQPKTKISHEPDDWEVLFPTAKKGGTWGEHPINMNSPVVGVDWWDAFAYAKWKQAYLPTQEQWLGALMTGTRAPSDIPVSGLLPVNEETQDRTSNGLLGMAGSVSEWTGEPRPSPSNPLGDPLWVIIGGSYLNPAQGALSRDWISNRMTRRPDLGFRIGKNIVED